MNEIFSKNGYLSSVIPNYEFRKEQLHMADFILERLYESENGLIEAGTGTGKTLAYLVPLVRYALEQEKKIVISTETKALQRQLIEKDIPIVKRIFNEHYNLDFSCSLCLGSSNYPCRKRFEAALKSGAIQAGELKKLGRLAELFEENRIFSRFDVTVPNYLWSEIHREGDSCNSYRCPFGQQCSYQLARKEWSQSNVLVMNHYLFFANIAAGKTYLPVSDIVIFDEAHSLEDIAAAQLGFTIGFRELLEIIGLFHGDRRTHLIGCFPSESLRDRCTELVQRIIRETNRFFEGVRAIGPSEKNSFRVREPVPSGNELVELLKGLLLVMTDAEDDFDETNPRRIEFDIARGRLFAYTENLSSFVFQHNDNRVFWIEREPETMMGDLTLRGQPVALSEVFNKEIIACYDSTLFVSATLAIGDDFSYIVDRLGIEHHRSLPLKSSFDYRSQVILYIARDIADPAGASYPEQASAEAAEIIGHLKGNCLLLFTSYRSLRDVRLMLSDMIDNTIYSQDLMPSTDAYGQYVNDPDSVLMGTHSFWQGIDLPGDLVRGVIVMKLPFAVPDSPPVQARMELLAAQGKNPFSSFQIPEAVIRFKQGFGRLIRSSTDRGVVAVLDSRIATKSYGKFFLKAIPECKIVYSMRELKEHYSDMIG